MLTSASVVCEYLELFTSASVVCEYLELLIPAKYASYCSPNLKMLNYIKIIPLVLSSVGGRKENYENLLRSPAIPEDEMADSHSRFSLVLIDMKPWCREENDTPRSVQTFCCYSNLP